MKPERDWSAELAAARDAEDWELHAKIWEERRLQSVEADEAELEASLKANLPEGFYHYNEQDYYFNDHSDPNAGYEAEEPDWYWENDFNYVGSKHHY